MTALRFRGRLPDGSYNGLVGQVASQFESDPSHQQVAVCLLGVKAVTADQDKDELIVTLRILRIEAIVRPDDQTAMKRIMMRAAEERSGQTMLPFDTEEEIDASFREWSNAEDTEGAPRPEEGGTTTEEDPDGS